jgi:transcriptional regulator with XRE-family HTH domain
MNLNNWIKNKLELYKDDPEFRFESLILDITESISRKMIKKNINRTKLAELLNISRPAVTKILNGNSNFTLKTLLSLSAALDLDLKIEFKEKETMKTDFVEAGYQTTTDIILTGESLSKFTHVSSNWYSSERKMLWEEAA